MEEGKKEEDEELEEKKGVKERGYGTREERRGRETGRVEKSKRKEDREEGKSEDDEELEEQKRVKERGYGRREERRGRGLGRVEESKRKKIWKKGRKKRTRNWKSRRE